MKQIELTQGVSTTIDDEDFAAVSKYSLHLTGRVESRYVTIYDPAIKKHIYLHRFLTNCPDGMLVDHINRNTLDNRKANLRICTKSQNNANNNRAKAKLKGIHKEGSKWRPIISYNGKDLYFGTYETPIEAAMCYDAVAVYFFREFASLNFPEFKEEYLRQAEELDEVENEEC